MKLFHRSPVNRRYGEFLQFPTLGSPEPSLIMPPSAALALLSNKGILHRPCMASNGQPIKRQNGNGHCCCLELPPGIPPVSICSLFCACSRTDRTDINTRHTGSQAADRDAMSHEDGTVILSLTPNLRNTTCKVALMPNIISRQEAMSLTSSSPEVIS